MRRPLLHLLRPLLPMLLAASAGTAVPVRSTAAGAFDGGSQYRFRHITDKEGLKYTWIWHIAQDSQGFLWFSTMYGAYRYDGYAFEEYAFTDRTTGTQTNVAFVFEDPHDGMLWFGTDDGLYRHDRRCNAYEHFSAASGAANRLSSDNVLCMARTDDGTLWVGTDRGLDRIDPATRRCRRLAAGSGGTAVTALCGRGGTLWIGDSDGGVWRLDDGETPRRIPLAESHHAVKALFEDSRRRLWIGTEGSGLFRLDPDGGLGHYRQADGTLSNDIVRAVREDGEGVVWAGTEKGITLLSDEGTAYIYHRRNDPWGLNDNAVYSLFRDTEGTMWVGTFFGGINAMNARYALFGELLPEGGGDEASLRGCAVSSVAADAERIVVGTENRGIFIYDTGTRRMRNLDGRRGLGSDNVHAVCIDDRGNIWTGHFYGGLDRIPPRGPIHRYRTRAGDDGALPVNSVYCVRQDRSGHLWIGTRYGGLCRYDYAADRFVRTEGLPPGLFVWDIREDRRGDIWLACYDAGIYRLDRSRGYRPTRIETTARKYVTLCELADGRMLAGTEKEGITVIAPDGTAAQLTSARGLPDDTVYGIMQDASGAVWFSSNRGIWRCDTAFTRFSNYTLADGLPGNRFNYNACASFGGRLWFGSVEGLVAIDPAREVPLSEGYPIRFCNLYIHNRRQAIAPDGPLREDLNAIECLTLRSNRLTWGVDFTCNLFGSNDLQYAYRLEGMDDDWHRLGNRRRIDFTGLGYGRYRLLVCTLDAAGEPSANRRALEVWIRPPWWRSRGAKAAYLTLALALTGFLVRLRRNNARTRHAFELERLAREKEKEINEMKLRFFVNVSHEFKTPLALIIGPIGALLDSTLGAQQRERYLNVVRKNAEKLLGLVNELLAFRELEHLRLHIRPLRYRPAVEAVLNRYAWLFESRDIRVELRRLDEGLVVRADADKLEKILNNLLSNAYKYTPEGGWVTIEATDDGRCVTTAIANSGEGIPADKLPHIFERFFTSRSYDRYSSGVGLSYVKSLVEMHGGTIGATSQAGGPTRFTFTLPSRGQDETAPPAESPHYDIGVFDREPDMPDDAIPEEDEAYRRIERRTSVLIVDDDTDMRNLLVDALAQRFHTTGVPDADAALRLIAEQRVDIVASDVMLGEGMNGFALCRRLKTDIETSHIRVILMTVLSENNYREQGYKAGADAYVVKPFEFSLLTLRIRNLIYNAWKAREAYRTDTDLTSVGVMHSDSDEQFLKRAVEVVFAHLSDAEFTVEQLCHELAMSQSSLYRKLKGTTGQSINEFIQNIRLKQAARLLRQTQKTVAEITFEVGFSDSSYFSRAFRKCFGVSPRQWRERPSAEKE